MDFLVCHGARYTYQQLCAGNWPAGLGTYEQCVLTFCQQWLTEQEHFTLQTSGSTGQPKAIALTRAQMRMSARWTGAALGLQPGDHALVCLSAAYIAGIMMLVRGFELGLQLTIIDPVSRPLAALASAEPIDFTAMVPLQLQETLQGSAAERERLHAMKAVLIGGAPLTLALETQLQHVRAPLYHTYGMTETVSHIALRRLNGPQRSDRFVPFEGVRLALDARGCLLITSALTGGATLRTNDLVELYADGSFRWLGRSDYVINSGGFKVHIEQVERALEAWLLEYQHGHYAPRRFFVGALPHPRLGQAVVAVMEGVDDAGTDPGALTAALRTALRPALPRYAIPQQLYFVPHLQETPTGKIDRGATLRALAAQGLERPAAGE